MKKKHLLSLTALSLVLGLTIATGVGSTPVPRADEKEVTEKPVAIALGTLEGDHNFADSRIHNILIKRKLKGNDNFANMTVHDIDGETGMWIEDLEGDRNFTNTKMYKDYKLGVLYMYIHKNFIGDDNFDGTVCRGFKLRVMGTLKGRMGKVTVDRENPYFDEEPEPYIRASVIEDADFSKMDRVEVLVDDHATGDYLFANKEYVSVGCVAGYFKKKTPKPVTIKGKHLFKGCKEVEINMYYSADEELSKYNTVIDDPYLFEDLAECEKVTVYCNFEYEPINKWGVGFEIESKTIDSEYIEKLVKIATVRSYGKPNR